MIIIIYPIYFIKPFSTLYTISFSNPLREDKLCPYFHVGAFP